MYNIKTTILCKNKFLFEWFFNVFSVIELQQVTTTLNLIFENVNFFHITRKPGYYRDKV